MLSALQRTREVIRSTEQAIRRSDGLIAALAELLYGGIYSDAHENQVGSIQPGALPVLRALI